MRRDLEVQVRREWERMRRAEMQAEHGVGGEGVNEDYGAVLEDESVRVDVSERDRDPFGIVFAKVGA